MIYKIAPAAAWQRALAAGQLAPSADDARDGYIHLSTREQLAGTLRKHFGGLPGLVLLAVEPRQLGAQLRWEPSRAGQEFPHLYGELPVSAVQQVWQLPVKDGSHQLPDWSA